MSVIEENYKNLKNPNISKLLTLAFKGLNNLQQYSNNNTEINCVLITDFFLRVDIFGCLFRDPACCLFFVQRDFD